MIKNQNRELINSIDVANVDLREYEEKFQNQIETISDAKKRLLQNMLLIEESY